MHEDAVSIYSEILLNYKKAGIPAFNDNMAKFEISFIEAFF